MCLIPVMKCNVTSCHVMPCLYYYRANNKELRECRDQIQMYQEMTAVKDQVVVSLTNQVPCLRLLYLVVLFCVLLRPLTVIPLVCFTSVTRAFFF